jgi:hypothetical protein
MIFPGQFLLAGTRSAAPFKKRAVLYEKMLGAASAPLGDASVIKAWLHLALTNNEPIAY